MTDRPPTCKPPCPGPDAHVAPQGGRSCNGHVKNGDRKGMACLKPPMRGQAICERHGGRAGQNRRAGAERQRAQKMTTAVHTLGLPSDVDPAQALLDEVHWTAGHVAWLRERVQQLDEEQLTWGMTKSKSGGDDRGDTFEARPSIWYGLYERERDRLVKVCAEAIKAGIAERQVRLAEQQGALVAGAIRQILDRLHLTAVQLELVPQVVPEVLRGIAAQPAPPPVGGGA